MGMNMTTIPNPLDFSGKSIVITGGASGLGFAIARTFFLHGASLTLLDRDEKRGAEAVRTLDESGSRVRFIPVDVSSHASVEDAFGQIDALKAPVDIHVNSAGIREITSSIDIDPEEFARVVGINLNGTFYASQQAARRMRESGGGSIINIASVAGMIGIRNRPAYVASKHGVVGLTKLLAADFAEYGIRVNAIAPGTIRTPMTEQYYHDDRFLAGIAKVVPLGAGGDANDIANAALFLSSPLAGFVTGIVLPVDGGWVAEKTYSPDPTAYNKV